MRHRGYLLLMLAFGGAVSAQLSFAEKVYKCTDLRGVVTYQQTTCESGAKLEEKNLDTQRNVVQVEVPHSVESEESKAPSSAGGVAATSGTSGGVDKKTAAGIAESLPPQAPSALEPTGVQPPLLSPAPVGPGTPAAAPAPPPTPSLPAPPGSSAF